MKICAIICNAMRLDGGSMYGRVPKALWEKWTPADASNRIQLACRCLFLQTDDGRNVLFDVGAGDFFEPRLKERYGLEGNFELLHRLAKIGVSEKDIDLIILSHLHFDHAGGLLSPYGEGSQRLLFKNAKYYLSKTHWEHARNSHLFEKASFIPVLHSLLKDSNRLILIEDSSHPDLDFGLSFNFSNGHTIGLMLSRLHLQSGPLVYASDLVPGIPWVHLPVTMGYDRFGELIVNEKEILLEEMVRQNGQILLTHDFTTASIRISKDSNGKYICEPENLFSL